MALIHWEHTPKSNLFDYLAGYRFILVTGPQRAGTTIATAMIANDLGYNYADEEIVQATGFFGFTDRLASLF